MFEETFLQLKNILKQYEGNCTVVADTPDNYYLNAGYSQKYKKDLTLGAVQVKKNYVSFHYFPVYMFPELLLNISPELKKRMQGKACFNFKKPEPELFPQLEELVNKGVERFRKENLV